MTDFLDGRHCSHSSCSLDDGRVAVAVYRFPELGARELPLNAEVVFKSVACPLAIPGLLSSRWGAARQIAGGDKHRVFLSPPLG